MERRVAFKWEFVRGYGSAVVADFAHNITADFVARLGLTALLAPTTALGSRPAPETPSGRRPARRGRAASMQNTLSEGTARAAQLATFSGHRQHSRRHRRPEVWLTESLRRRAARPTPRVRAWPRRMATTSASWRRASTLRVVEHSMSMTYFACPLEHVHGVLELLLMFSTSNRAPIHFALL